MMVIIAILSIISWRFVEIPFRSLNWLSSHRAAFTFGSVASASVIAVGMLINLQKIVPYQIDDELLILEQDIKWNGSDYVSNSTSTGVSLGVARIGEHSPDFVLWGDSHGLVVAPLLDSLAKDYGMNGIAFLNHGIPPITNLWQPLKEGDKIRVNLPEFNNKRFDSIIQSGTKNVILVARWNVYFKGFLPTEIDEIKRGTVKKQLVADSSTTELTFDASKQALSDQLSKMLEQFESNNIRVWLMLQAPSASRPRVAHDYYLTRRFPLLNSEDFSKDTTREEYSAYMSDSLQLFNGLDAENLIIINPIETFYGGENKLLLYSNRAYFKDEDHLTRQGVERYLRPLFSDVLDKIASDDLSSVKIQL
jgi:hypothetical protein